MRAHQAMSVVVLATTIIISVSSLESLPLETPEFTREQEFILRNGAFALPSGSDGIFILSVTNRTINIKSTDSRFKPCSMLIDPFEDAIKGEIRAKLLDSSDKIIIWGIGDMDENLANDTRTVYYSMLLIELRQCESVGISLPEDRLPLSQQLFLPEIIDYHYAGFDVHYTSQRYCSPCSFESDGRRKSRDGGPLQAEGIAPVSPIQLKSIYPTKDSMDKIYAFNFANRTAVVKLLDSDYQVKRIKYFEYPVDVVYAKGGRIRNVGYCYQERDSSSRIYCERLDSRLKSVVSVLLPLEQSARKVSLEYDMNGNFFIAVVLSAELRVFAYDVFGQLVATLDFGQVGDTKQMREMSAYFEGEQYCLIYSTELRDSTAKNDANNIVKCINTRKYIKI